MKAGQALWKILFHYLWYQVDTKSAGQSSKGANNFFVLMLKCIDEV